MEHFEVQKVEVRVNVRVTVRVSHMHVSFHPRDFDSILSSEKDPLQQGYQHVGLIKFYPVTCSLDWMM